MAEFTFEQMMRAGHVKRWQIVRVAREQTVAEHMWRVWMITNQINYALQTPPPIAAVAQQWALIHDMPEVLTGDLATPFKRMMREHIPKDDPIRNIELELSDNYRLTWEESKKHPVPGWPCAYEIVKLADQIEAKCFLGCEKLGNHAEEVWAGLCVGLGDTMCKMQHLYREPEWIRMSDIIERSWSRV